jgi:hypothetical protein
MADACPGDALRLLIGCGRGWVGGRAVIVVRVIGPAAPPVVVEVDATADNLRVVAM